MDGEALRLAVQTAGPVALVMAFGAGFAFSFNPVALAAIPVATAYVTKSAKSGQARAMGAAFIGGMLLVHVLAGMLAGWGGSWIELALGRWWGLVVGPVLIVLGLMWPGWLRVPLPRIALRGRRPSGLAGALLLGAVFSVAVCPVCTPALLVLIGVALASGSPLWGALLLLVFAIGRAIPVAASAWAVGWAKGHPKLAAYRQVFETAGGLVLVASGLYMLNAYFFWVPALAV